MSLKALQMAQGQQVKRVWWLVDAKGWRVGRLASHLSRLLLGKHKPLYTPSAGGAGDVVVVINADKTVFSGKKLQQKLYRSHTTYPGGLKEVSAKRMLKNHPTRILQKAVSGMLPKNRLRRLRMENLKLIEGEEHPFRAQLCENPYKLDMSAPVREYDFDRDGFPESGYIMTLNQTDDNELIIESEEVLSRKDKKKEEIRKERAARAKALKAYVLGRGPRPDFLPNKAADLQ